MEAAVLSLHFACKCSSMTIKTSVDFYISSLIGAIGTFNWIASVPFSPKRLSNDKLNILHKRV